MDCKNITNLKRVTVFAGHYGSGKTNIAINYALNIAASGLSVEIVDLDIVNPYFRTKDAENILKTNGINLISSITANSNVDTPALPAQAYSAVQNTQKYAVIDVGGDDRGALALGRYVPYLQKENNYEMLFVINKYRYLTSTAKDTFQIMKEIEFAAGINFSAIINNSNLGNETTEKDVIESEEYAQSVSQLSALPIKFTAVQEELAKNVKNKIQNVLPIKICVKQSF